MQRHKVTWRDIFRQKELKGKKSIKKAINWQKKTQRDKKDKKRHEETYRDKKGKKPTRRDITD